MLKWLRSDCPHFPQAVQAKVESTYAHDIYVCMYTYTLLGACFEMLKTLKFPRDIIN